MSHFHLSIDFATLKKNNATPSQAQIDALADIIRQCRSEEDTRRDDAAEAEHEISRAFGETYCDFLWRKR